MPEPSAISTSSMDGSPSGIRTIRDSGPQRGRFRSGPRTFHEIDLQRGWFNHWYPNHPRFRPSAWTVPLWIPNRPRYMPPAWTVRPLLSEPSAIHAQNLDGSLLRYEPSVISTPSVDGSPPGIRTIRDSGPERRWFRFGPRTFHDIDLHHGWLALWYLNLP